MDSFKVLPHLQKIYRPPIFIYPIYLIISPFTWGYLYCLCDVETRQGCYDLLECCHPSNFSNCLTPSPQDPSSDRKKSVTLFTKNFYIEYIFLVKEQYFNKTQNRFQPIKNQRTLKMISLFLFCLLSIKNQIIVKSVENSSTKRIKISLNLFYKNEFL